MRSIIASAKITTFLLLCLTTIPLMALSTILFSRGLLFYVVPKFFYGAVCFIFGVKVRVTGTAETGQHTIFVGNHLSYIDIAAIGQTLPATFISKAEIANWPILGLLARIAKTIFIGRTRNAATKALTDIKRALDKGHSLIMFPEGTSTNGKNVLPFKSTIFELFLNDQLKDRLMVQPFTITLTHIDKQPAQTDDDYDLYAWYGDMEFTSHLWQFAKGKGAKITVKFHKALPAVNYTDRKEFALEAQKLVAQGLDFPAEAA